MARTKIIGWTAMAVCVLGYAGGAALLVGGRMDNLDMTQAVLLGAGAMIVGEIGLWVAAACLGFTMFKKRKALIDRVLRRNRPAEPTPSA